MVLKGNETRIVTIGPAQVEFLSSARLGFLYRLPEKEGGGAEIVVRTIRTSILINNGIFEAESNNTGNRCILVRSDSNLERIAHARHQVAKPFLGLRRYLMTPPCKQHQMVELPQKTI